MIREIKNLYVVATRRGELAKQSEFIMKKLSIFLERYTRRPQFHIDIPMKGLIIFFLLQKRKKITKFHLQR
jgi:hypothetical protein